MGVPATRRAAETAALVRCWGGSPIVAATFEEVAVEDEEPLRRATEEVIGTLLTHSVHLTGVGTNRWFARAAAWGSLDALLDTLRRAQVVARGPKSSAALRAHGIEPAWIPQSETSHEIAQRLLEEVGPKSVVSLQRHGEPVPELVDALLAAGALVIEIAPLLGRQRPTVVPPSGWSAPWSQGRFRLCWSPAPPRRASSFWLLTRWGRRKSCVPPCDSGSSPRPWGRWRQAAWVTRG